MPLNGSECRKYFEKSIAKETSPPWRGEFRAFNAVVNWGGLLNSEQNDEVSDTTDDDSSTKAG